MGVQRVKLWQFAYRKTQLYAGIPKASFLGFPAFCVGLLPKPGLFPLVSSFWAHLCVVLILVGPEI